MIKLKGWFGPYLAMAIRLGLMLLLYTFLRLGFYGFNATQFPQVAVGELLFMLAGGVKFDIVGASETEIFWHWS